MATVLKNENAHGLGPKYLESDEMRSGAQDLESTNWQIRKSFSHHKTGLFMSAMTSHTHTHTHTYLSRDPLEMRI